MVGPNANLAWASAWLVVWALHVASVVGLLACQWGGRAKRQFVVLVVGLVAWALQVASVVGLVAWVLLGAWVFEVGHLRCDPVWWVHHLTWIFGELVLA